MTALFKCLELWDPFDDLTLKQLTLKTVAQAALVPNQRSPTLDVLRVDATTKTQDAIQFVLRDILKTTRPGKVRFA